MFEPERQLPSQAHDKTSGAKLSSEAARFYASIFEMARRACIAELRAIGCPEADAEEHFMATCEKLIRTVDPIGRDFDPPQMVNFMKTTCKRRFVDERRHRARYPQTELTGIPSLQDPTTERPDEVAEDRELVWMGRKAIRLLPRTDQLVFLLRYVFELSPAEIQSRMPGLNRRVYRRALERSNKRVLAAYEEIDQGGCERLDLACLTRYLFGEASDAERSQVKAHLQHCLPCQRTSAKLRGWVT
jgi:DNA-directed RNA polymerase specialized sigma24 family protein